MRVVGSPNVTNLSIAARRMRQSAGGSLAGGASASKVDKYLCTAFISSAVRYAAPAPGCSSSQP
jgi:hypothetical protein